MRKRRKIWKKDGKETEGRWKRRKKLKRDDKEEEHVTFHNNGDRRKPHEEKQDNDWKKKFPHMKGRKHITKKGKEGKRK